MTNRLIRSFEPAAASNARVVILGSMPGVRSLEAVQYYAHPRNAFWRIMQEVLGVDAEATYEQRIHALNAKGIALWDVLHSCHREGSLDAAIRRGSVKVNDFNAFFRTYSGVDAVLLNGAVAQSYYERYVVPGPERSTIRHTRMPSTSPAHAAMSFERKVGEWRQALIGRCVPLAPSAAALMDILDN